MFTAYAVKRSSIRRSLFAHLLPVLLAARPRADRSAPTAAPKAKLPLRIQLQGQVPFGGNGTLMSALTGDRPLPLRIGQSPPWPRRMMSRLISAWSAMMWALCCRLRSDATSCPEGVDHVGDENARAEYDQAIKQTKNF